MKRIAVVDIGTQSMNFLLARFEEGRIIPLDYEIASIRLGEKLAAQSIIQSAAVEKAVESLNQFQARATEQNADALICIGTHVFRAAINSADVLRAIKQSTGIDIEVLSQQEEARWSYLGATSGFESNGSVCVIDIGGGSTEITLGERSTILHSVSIPIGAVSITERFCSSRAEIETLLAFIESTIRSAWTFALPDRCDLIGVAGTVTTLAAMSRKMTQYDPLLIEDSVLTRAGVSKWLHRLIHDSPDQRKTIPGLPQHRADIIIGGTAILLTILEISGKSSIRASDRGLRFGIVLREMHLFS